MTDITNGLAELGEPPTGGPSEDTVVADLARGRAALHRRRLRTGGALSVAALAIGGTAGYLAVSGQPATPPAAQIHGPASAPAPAPGKIRLASYGGQQPHGFNVASVPQGFHLQTQASSAGLFVLAPPSADKQPDSFVGKLVVTAEAASGLGNWKADGNRWVTVHGERARIGNGGDATQLWFGVAHGIVVDVQAWNNIGLTPQQLVDFADGVTTTPALQLSHG
jgi:hypothetical protein